jgi:SNF2 family DNA or RNA helicase
VGAKVRVFLSTVKQLVAEGRRALVFSQFTSLLALWGADLAREGIAYEYLDGSTVERDAVIARFQAGAAPLFLISLKAGGAGLNLTAADTVIHCDPWWNPAVEEQATARAHRIGQTRAVTVYRLVARGTVEDRVDALKDRKRTLADAVIAADAREATALAGLTADDIAMLLADATGADDDEV